MNQKLIISLVGAISIQQIDALFLEVGDECLDLDLSYEDSCLATADRKYSRKAQKCASKPENKQEKCLANKLRWKCNYIAENCVVQDEEDEGTSDENTEGGVDDSNSDHSGASTDVCPQWSVSSIDSFNQLYLDSHNEKRSRHWFTNPLEFDSDLAADAYRYACELATNDNGLVHAEDRNGAGENLYWAWSSNPQSTSYFTTAKGADSWYDEIADYDFSTGTGTGVVGHFTQMVWHGTTRLGCGYAGVVDGVGGFVVCRYLDHGNIRGWYTSNVTCPGEGSYRLSNQTEAPATGC